MRASKLLPLLLLLLWPTAAWAHPFSGVVPTPHWVDFWGKLTFKGGPAEPGDQVAVFDPQGVLCGVTTVTEESAAGGSLYPFLHVYGDDSTTAAIDEGAVTGDVLEFMVYRASENKRYGASVRLDVQDEGAPDPPCWVQPTAPLSAWHVDVEVIELFWEMPNQNVPFGAQFEPVDLDTYVAEPSNVGRVNWSAEAAGPSLMVEIFEGHILVVTSPAGWSGSEVVTVTGECDGETTSQDVVFTVGDNRAPVLGLMPGPQEISEGETLSLELEATDPDGNAVTFSLSPEVDNARLVPLTPSEDKRRCQLVFRPDFNQAGDYEFTLTASDGYLADEDSVSILVQDVEGVEVVFSEGLIETGQEHDLTIEGTGTLLDGFRIIIPAGALPCPVQLTVSLIDESLLPPLPEGAFGFPFHIGPDGLVFNVPVTIIAPYGSSDPVGEVLAVYRYGDGVSGWSTEHISDVSIDMDEQLVTFKTTCLSSFTPAATTTPLEPESSGDGGGGCFIATAAFGSPLERHVATLRLVRDKKLLTCLPGRLLVAAYYRLGPAAANFISSQPQLRQPVRGMLYPLVGLSALVLGPPLLHLSLLGLILIGGAALAVARRRRI